MMWTWKAARQASEVRHTTRRLYSCGRGHVFHLALDKDSERGVAAIPGGGDSDSDGWEVRAEARPIWKEVEWLINNGINILKA